MDPQDIEIANMVTSKDLVEKFNKAGFKYLGDVQGMSVVDLSREAKVSLDDASMVLKFSNGELEDEVLLGGDDKPAEDDNSAFMTALKSETALELLQKTQQQLCISTSCSVLDAVLHGGIKLGNIYEFCGVPGVGKTQFVTQLAVNVQIPESLGGCGGEVLYIDTEGSFSIERLQSMAQYMIDSCKAKSSTFDMTVTQVAQKVYFYRVLNYVEHLALVIVIRSILTSNKNIKLIIFDSICAHLRHDFVDFVQRARLLQGVAQMLREYATEFNVAIVMTNQVTTKIADKKSKQPSSIIPAMGETWSHNCGKRIMLYLHLGRTFAQVTKTLQANSDGIPYQVTEQGIKDVNI